ncbi:DUF732 domain-containing protein [Antrihabitans cavernicola]|uniref:DUF732 domain-containing protein n=1 Tax=Antrihabitans cavernicola TaxID=2495913 RepID=A0A5A7SGD9_9NOCA|nr:DUF732 domain-containing protein [Spelaeibacter cavernicola]KAA0024644.1 DUF732 domain-containing protein [Spelaeibacter cavernicola]
MTELRFITARTVAALALVAAASGLLAGCGGDDSTATGSPTQASVASTTSAAAKSSKAQGSDAPSSDAPVTSPGAAATAPPEQPQPVPSGFPGPTSAPVDSRNQALIAELDKAGVKSSGNGENAVAIANFICASIRDGSTPDQMDTTVTAMAGVELNLAGSQMAPADAAKIYKDAAQKTYCK